jgi:very-short-patch-repair endonuclease
MLPYERRLKKNARALRSNMTEAEQKLWYRLRRKQINGWQFYRQKSLGPYIVDFYCPAACLVVEVDGSQHFDIGDAQLDQIRDKFLDWLGLRVLRFDNRQVLLETDAVVEVIAGFRQIPPSPPFSKGGAESRMYEGPGFKPKAAESENSMEKETTEPFFPFENEVNEPTPRFENEASEPAPIFEKETPAPVPPFEKGGLGGIFSASSSQEDEVEV